MIILAVDLGKARTGLAVCDQSEILASPADVITEYNPEKRLEKVAAEALARKAELLVVGLPRNMDGSEGESAQNARALDRPFPKKPAFLWSFRTSGEPPLLPMGI